MFLIFGRREKGVVEGVRALNLYSSCFFFTYSSQTLFAYDGVDKCKYIRVNFYGGLRKMCYKSSEPVLFIYLLFSGKIIAVAF